MKAFKVTLPWPPSVNNYWGNRVIPLKQGKQRYIVNTFVTERGKEFKAAVKRIIEKRLPELRPLECRLAYRMVFCPPDRRTRDISNFVKGVEDALQEAGLFKNDEQFDEVHLYRGPIGGAGCVQVTIWKHKKQPEQQPALFPTEEKF